jgi:hypothetical protein
MVPYNGGQPADIRGIRVLNPLQVEDIWLRSQSTGEAGESRNLSIQGRPHIGLGGIGFCPGGVSGKGDGSISVRKILLLGPFGLNLQG